MCRFLLFRSENKNKPEKYLTRFAAMCKKSRTPEGDKQEDGWGITWKENNSWKLRKSLLPIWEDKKVFSKIPSTDLFMVHARSAGFSNQKGNLNYNQPYLADSLSFVFNGMIRGVRLPVPLDGEIGAQKIFSLLKKETDKNTPEKALLAVLKTLTEHSQKIEGMNIGLVKDDKFYLLCEYYINKDYFTVRYFQDNIVTLVCSEPFGLYNWNSMGKGEIITL